MHHRGWIPDEFDRSICIDILGYHKFHDEIDWLALGVAIETSAEEDSANEICYARTTVPSMNKIDPELRYFTDALGPGLQEPGTKLQSQLERYGFTSSTTRPELPLYLLEDCKNRNNVFEATRRGYFWSNCAVPVLLQTCRESRHVMQLAGYQIILRHRTSGPRTWFNFDRDLLYLIPPQNPLDPNQTACPSIDSGPWGLGQMSPLDLNRVTRVALEDVFNFAGWFFEPPYFLLNTVRLFGNLKELILVASHQRAKIASDEPDHDDNDSAKWEFLDFEERDAYIANDRAQHSITHENIHYFLCHLCNHDDLSHVPDHARRR